ncbi:MAG: hypothetical protein BRC46_14700 [Cyanobacteria bacterium QS_6_48_18]|nr:MAG: hypothetical protein BRC46_14700 [Cyanobacteria bacterium QS_6_48_18]
MNLIFRGAQHYVNQKNYLTPQKAIITQKKELVLGIDEMWSFVGSKRNKVWIWLAIASLTKEIVGIHVGSRERIAARQLWESSTSLWSMC